MKKILISAIALIAINSAVSASDTYVGVSIGGGSGSFSYATDGDSYAYANDDITTSNMKVYAGMGRYYGFFQTGAITLSINDEDLDYTAFGIGYLVQADKFRKELGPVSLTPEFHVELGLDGATSDESGDFTGILIAADLGLSLGVKNIPLDFTVDLGYDVHVLNDDTNNDGSWNFSSMHLNFGARYNF